MPLNSSPAPLIAARVGVAEEKIERGSCVCKGMLLVGSSKVLFMCGSIDWIYCSMVQCNLHS